MSKPSIPRYWFEFGPGKKPGEFRVRIKAKGNHEIVLQGEDYTSKRPAPELCARLKHAFENDNVTLVELDKKGKRIKPPKYVGTVVSS